jgi:hypothetical protein
VGWGKGAGLAPQFPLSCITFHIKQKNGAGRKPGSVPAGAGGDHSSGTPVTRGLARPTRELGRATLDAPLFGLAPGGVFLAAGVAADAGELLPHLFTLTVAVPRRSGLCGTFRGVAPPGRYPAPCPVEPGLSSSRARRGQRSPGLLQILPISFRKNPGEILYLTGGPKARKQHLTVFAAAGQWPAGPNDRPRH